MLAAVCVRWVFVPVVEVEYDNDDGVADEDEDDGGIVDVVVVVVLQGHCKVGKFEHLFVLAVMVVLFVICVRGSLALLAPRLLLLPPFVGVMVSEAGRLLDLMAAFKDAADDSVADDDMEDTDAIAAC